jgi:hypothetical protein
VRKLLNIKISILLACTFLMAHAGIHVFNHYCGGTLTQQSISIEQDCCCGEMENDNCCTTAAKSFQIKDAFQVANRLKLTLIQISLLNPVQFVIHELVSEYVNPNPHTKTLRLKLPIIHLPFILRI